MTELNDILNTLHIRVYILSNKSKLHQYEYTHQLGDVMTVTDAMMIISLLSLLIHTHPWMIGNPISAAYNFHIQKLLQVWNHHVRVTPDQQELQLPRHAHNRFRQTLKYTKTIDKITIYCTSLC